MGMSVNQCVRLTESAEMQTLCCCGTKEACLEGSSENLAVNVCSSSQLLLASQCSCCPPKVINKEHLEGALSAEVVIASD